MAEAWHTLREAGELLGCSTRTIRRRIEAKQLQTRMGSDGRREVLIDPMTPVPDADRVTASRADTSLTVVTAQMVERIEHRADREVRRARRWGLAGWSIAAVLLIGVAVACWYVAEAITGRDVELRGAQAQAEDLRDQLVGLENDRDAASALAVALTDQRAEDVAQIATLTVEVQQARAQLDAERQRPAGWGQIWATIRRWLRRTSSPRSWPT